MGGKNQDLTDLRNIGYELSMEHNITIRRASGILFFAVALVILSIAALKRNYLWADGIAFWSDAAKKSPAKTRPHNNLGEALIEASRYDDAMSALFLSIKADKWYIEPHYNLALCYIKKKLFDEAIPELEEALRINAVLKKGHFGAQAAPRHETQSHSNLGNIYNIKGMFDKAVFHYKEALKVSPKDASTHFNLAMTYETIGMLKEARAEFEEVLSIDPADEGARRGMNRLLP